MGEVIRSVRDLVVYKKAFDVAMAIFEISKTFPKEEKYSLTDQMRRSSRSVCANLSEAWRKIRFSKNSLKTRRKYSPCFTPWPKNPPLFAEVELFCFPLPSSFFPLP